MTTRISRRPGLAICFAVCCLPLLCSCGSSKRNDPDRSGVLTGADGARIEYLIIRARQSGGGVSFDVKFRNPGPLGLNVYLIDVLTPEGRRHVEHPSVATALGCEPIWIGPGRSAWDTYFAPCPGNWPIRLDHYVITDSTLKDCRDAARHARPTG